MSSFQLGETPLSVASKSGHVECVQLLLQQDNIAINKANLVSILIILFYMYRYYHVYPFLCFFLCSSLLQKYLCMKLSSFQSGETPLLVASRSGHVECVRLLLQQENIDINKAGRVSSLIFLILNYT